jgi:hypothetical protein
VVRNGLTKMSRENDGTDGTAKEGIAHGGAGLLDADPGLGGLAGPLGRGCGPASGPADGRQGPDGGHVGSHVGVSACLVERLGDTLEVDLVSKVSEPVGHHACDDGSAGFLVNRGASIVPFGDLRGPAVGPTPAVSHGDSTLSGAPACHSGQRGALSGLPGGHDGHVDAVRAARVVEAVVTYMTGRGASPRQARRRTRRRGRKMSLP